MRDLQKHIGYYSVLVIVGILGIYLMSKSAADQEMRMLIVTLIAFFYVVWGTVHHLVNHDLTARIVLEYVLVGSLGIALIFFLIK